MGCDSMTKADELFNRYIEGPYGLKDMADLNELTEKGCIKNKDEYWKFVHIFNDGIIDDEELSGLQKEGYPKDFTDKLKKLVGENGANAVSKRAEWLGDNCVTKWSRSDYSADTRMDMFRELARLIVSPRGIGPDEVRGSIESLTEALEDDDPIVHFFAVSALIKIGPAATPSLIKAFKDVTLRMSKISPFELLEHKYDFLRTENKTVTDALVKIGATAVPYLIEELKDENLYVSGEAADLLIKIGNVAVPDVLKALKDENPKVCLYAIYILGETALETKDVVQALSKMAADGGNPIAEDALRRIRARGPEIKTIPQKDESVLPWEKLNWCR